MVKKVSFLLPIVYCILTLSPRKMVGDNKDENIC